MSPHSIAAYSGAGDVSANIRFGRTGEPE